MDCSTDPQLTDHKKDECLEQLTELVRVWERGELVWSTDEQVLLTLAVEHSIAKHRPLSQLKELILSLCFHRDEVQGIKLDQLVPAESVLVDHYVRPVYDATLSAIRQSIAHQKCFFALSRTPLGPGDEQQENGPALTFVMVGTLHEDKVGDLFVLNAVDLAKFGCTSEQLFFDSVVGISC